MGDVFGTSMVSTSDARCILDWERYVVMLNATSPRPLAGFWMGTPDGGRVAIEQSTTENNINDWLDEARFQVRKGKPFRSRYWEWLYFSVPTLLQAAQREFNPLEGDTLFVNLHFSNQAPWHVFGRTASDLVVKVRREP